MRSKASTAQIDLFASVETETDRACAVLDALTVQIVALVERDVGPLKWERFAALALERALLEPDGLPLLAGAETSADGRWLVACREAADIAGLVASLPLADAVKVSVAADFARPAAVGRLRVVVVTSDGCVTIATTREALLRAARTTTT